LVIAAYVAVNLAVGLTNVDIETTGSLGHRCGWYVSILPLVFPMMMFLGHLLTRDTTHRLALVNLTLVIFLALKNTPLAFLTAYSYERLNCLHQVAGCAMFIAMLLHAALYTAFFNDQGRLVAIYSESGEIAAIVAGFAFLSVVFSALVLRSIWYELFYVTHILSWIVGVIAVGFHRPEFANKTLIIVLIAASMWFVDRVIRACRVLYYSANNEATLHPLPDGSTKIVMKKVPARAEPGKHCFVWIPAIRMFETHPFTIHGSSPVEFTVKACNGFTGDLHKYALANPGAVVKASIDGPYGTFPDPMEFDKIVLIAGGGGATFTFGLAVNVLERMNDDSPKNIVFIWSVKKHGKFDWVLTSRARPKLTRSMTENLSWFKDQLELLRTHAHSTKVNVSLYVTRDPMSRSDLPSESDSDSSDRAARFDSSSVGTASPPMSPVGPDPEKNASSTAAPAVRRPSLSQSDREHSGSDEKDLGTTVAARSPTFFNHPVKAGRPDAASLIRDAVRTTPRNQRVLVAACGPNGLMHVVRDTTAKLIVGDGPAVELHCEEFGW
jgi:predicted ferric reductase